MLQGSITIKPKAVSHNLINNRQERPENLRPLLPEVAKLAGEALEFICKKALDKLVFYFETTKQSCSGGDLPELLSQTNLSTLQKGAAALGLYNDLQSGKRRLPDRPGSPIHIRESLEQLGDARKVAQFRRGLELAAKTKNPMELLKPSAQKKSGFDPNAVRLHSYSDPLRHHKTSKSTTVKGTLSQNERPETTIVQPEVLLAKCLEGLKNPALVAKKGIRQIGLLWGKG
ncbi:MAG: hypothetical protein HQ564_10425 [Candidatus Saganbacteria bacterium]|nr:hypothetical protein [Candidatus Saganbacteria bacterium]